MFNNWKLSSETDEKFIGFVDNENLYEKLKLLNYQTELATGLKLKPIHKYYFMIQKNPGEQFFMFASIAAWLVRKMGGNFEQPQEYDDPNITLGNIVDIVRETSAVDFPPNKLKQGWGEHVVFVLDTLADQALSHLSFKFKSFVPPKNDEEEEEILEDESELMLEQVEEDMLAYYSDESDNDTQFKFNNFTNISAKQEENVLKLDKNVINEEEWKLELERVMPKLKVTITNSNRDWRTHLDQMRQNRQSIDSVLNGTKSQLDKLYKNISDTLDKVSIREKYLNRELEDTLDEFRNVQDQLSHVKETYQNVSGGVSERTRELALLNDRLENLKQEMDERGSSMTDGTPLVNIKKAISKVKSEIVQMDIRIGVLDCLLLQYKVQENKLLEDDLNQYVY